MSDFLTMNEPLTTEQMLDSYFRKRLRAHIKAQGGDLYDRWQRNSIGIYDVSMKMREDIKFTPKCRRFGIQGIEKIRFCVRVAMAEYNAIKDLSPDLIKIAFLNGK